MISVLLFLTTSVLFTIITVLFFSLLFKNRLLMQKRVKALVEDPAKISGVKDEVSKQSHWLASWLEKARYVAAKRLSEHQEEALQRRINDAGKPYNLRPVDFILIRIGLAIVFFFIIFFPFLTGTESLLRLFILATFASLFGFVYPSVYLNAMKRKRTEAIQKMMPDFFDMVKVTIEAGLGLDGALHKVSRQMQGPLSEEFLLTLEAMKFGTSKKQAFTELRERVPSEQFQSVISALIQADQMGIGMSKVLRAQTVRIRETRRQQAREQAMKAPVKMMIPMVLFIFPTLFVVLLGPIVVQLVTEWL